MLRKSTRANYTSVWSDSPLLIGHNCRAGSGDGEQGKRCRRWTTKKSLISKGKSQNIGKIVSGISNLEWIWLGVKMPEAGFVDELAKLLLDYLPGPGPGLPLTPASFQGIAKELDLQKYWQGQEKSQSIKKLLEGTLAHHSEKFPILVLEIIQRSSKIRSNNNAFTQQDLSQILECLRKMEINVPELESLEYMKQLPSGEHVARPTHALQKMPAADLYSRMRKELIALTMMPENERGYALELFLNKLFANSDLKQLAPFRRQENVVSGKVKIGKQNAILFAFNQFEISPMQLQESVESVPREMKCIVISLPSFTEELRNLIATTGNTNLIAIDLRDIFLVLDGGASLEQMIGLKTIAAEKGKSYVLAQELLWG